MIKVSTTGMVVSLKTDLRFPIPGQQGHGGRIIHPYLVTELKESNSKQKLRTYQKRFEKYDLIIADELGYVSFDREAARV